MGKIVIEFSETGSAQVKPWLLHESYWHKLHITSARGCGTGRITALLLGAGPQLRKRLRPQATNMEVRLTVVFSAARGEQQWKGL
jgi:hypothetical protein